MLRGSDASAVVKVLESRLVGGCVEAGLEGVEPGRRSRDRGATVARAQWGGKRHDVVPVIRESAAVPARSAAPYQRTTGLPMSAALRRPGCAS